MDRIESYEQCVDMIKEFKKSCNKTVTNFYFLPYELKEIIAQGRVFYQLSENALVFYTDEREYTCVYYFLEEGTGSVVTAAGRTMLLDFVVRGSGYEKARETEIERWRASGFEFYKEYVRMQCDLKIRKPSKEDALQSGICELVCACYEDAEEIGELWQESLDRFSVSIPDVEEVRQMIKSRHVYCLKRAGEIAGTVYMDVTADRCVLKHLAVKSVFRRHGFGMIIINHALCKVSEENVNTCCLWVAADNTAAYKSYRKYGFREDGLKSGRLICR